MKKQEINNTFWSKIFVEYGVDFLCEKTGVSRGVLYNIKNNIRPPSFGVQRKLRDSLNTSIDEMFPFSTDEPKAA